MNLADLKKVIRVTIVRAANLVRPIRMQPPLTVDALLKDTTGRTLVEQFHKIWYGSDASSSVKWLGVPTLKNPLDMWMYQQVLFDCRPDILIETGTHRGGSALYFASVARAMQLPLRVITIDINPKIDFDAAMHGVHPIVGISTHGATRRTVADYIGSVGADLGRPPAIMVVLDSDHSRDNVAEELRCFAPLVTAGQYLVVEDTNINGHPVFPAHGPGPYEAVEEFLQSTTEFVVDATCERFLMTFNPHGWLRRIR